MRRTNNAITFNREKLSKDQVFLLETILLVEGNPGVSVRDMRLWLWDNYEKAQEDLRREKDLTKVDRLIQEAEWYYEVHDILANKLST